MLRDAIEGSDRTRDELVAISKEAAQLRADHDERRTERETLRQRQLLSETVSLGARLDEARRLQTAAALRPTGTDFVDEAAVDEIKLGRERLADLEGQLATVSREAQANEPDVERLETEQRLLVTAVDGLSPYAQVDPSQESTVRATVAALDEVAARPADEAPIPPRDETLARYRAERSELILLAAGRQPSRVRRAAWIVLVVLTAGLALLVRRLGRRIRPAKPSDLDQRLVPYRGATLDDLDRRCADEDTQIARAQALAEARAEQVRAAGARRAELESSLAGVLDTAGAPPAPLEERAAAYLLGCDGRSEYVARSAVLERVRRELAEVRRPQIDLQRLQRERDDAETRLRARYAAVGIEEALLDDARRRLDESLASDVRRRVALQDADASRKALASVLGDESLEELDSKNRAAQEQLDAHAREHGSLTAQAGDPAQVAMELAELEESLRDDAARLAELDERARALEEELGDPASLKERLAGVEDERNRLLEARDAVGLARQVLKDAADELSREFAPHLNDALCRNLVRITGGRYREALVDSDLTVKVVAPETGLVVSADHLSRATKDQIFLVERLEIARLLAPTKGSAPLLLDDPFAHYDETRLRYGLEIVAETAETRQVVLFSEDPSLATLARDLCASCSVIELAAAPLPVGAGV
jgi:uncharacterized protein YhaN